MANTFTYGDLINSIANSVARTREEAVASLACNMATTLIWNAFDWRETIETLPPFWLTPDSQDYGPPAVIVPVDFQGLRDVNLVQLNATPPRKFPLKVKRDLSKTHAYGLPNTIAFNRATQSFRVFPRPTPNIASPNWLIEGTYKKIPPKLVSSTYAVQPLFSEDMYFSVWVAALKWAFKDISGANDAPQAYAMAQQAILKMAENEGLNLGQTDFYPSESLADRYANNLIPGVWGF